MINFTRKVVSLNPITIRLGTILSKYNSTSFSGLLRTLIIQEAQNHPELFNHQKRGSNGST